jgi:hypothetical protein
MPFPKVTAYLRITGDMLMMRMGLVGTWIRKTSRISQIGKFTSSAH